MQAKISQNLFYSTFFGVALFLYHPWAFPAESLTPINGSVSVSQSGLVVLELDDTLSSPANLFDLNNTTLRFTPQGDGYSIESLDSKFEESLGAIITEPKQSLSNFQFSFAGTDWSEIYINEFGTVSFGKPDNREYFADMRFQGIQSLSSAFIDSTPTISPLFSPRLNGKRYIRELADRAIVTWELSEACCGIFEYIFERNTNTFQVVLHDDGVIEFNYENLATSEGLVGLFGKSEQKVIGNSLGTLSDSTDNQLPSYLDVISAEVSDLAGQGISIEITLRENFSISNLENSAAPFYRAFIDIDSPLISGIDYDDADYIWEASIDSNGKLVASGEGVFRDAFVSDGKIVIQGKIPSVASGDSIALFIDSVDFTSSNPQQFDQVNAVQFEITSAFSQEFDFSANTSLRSGNTAYEIFRYRSVPNSRDIACKILPALGDNYDLLVSYSQMRMDTPEGSTPVDPLETGVEGIGVTRSPRNSAYCSGGRLKSAHVLPIFMDANIATSAGPNGRNDGYNYALSLLGHEFGHTWGIDLDVMINGELISLNDTLNHWRAGLHTPVAHPWILAGRASAMGGGVWQDNQDGTFTQNADNFLSPATGYSYLDLYLMGVIPATDVPDFFLVDDLQFLRTDTNGQAIYSGERVDISIEDIVARNGDRKPNHEESQKDYKVAFVYLIETGSVLDNEKFNRMGIIRDQFSDYYSFITGGLGSMESSDSETAPSADAIFDANTNLLMIPSLGIGSDSYSLNLRLISNDPVEFELASYQLLDATPRTFSSEFRDGVLIIPELFIDGESSRIELTIISEEPPLFRLSNTAEL